MSDLMRNAKAATAVDSGAQEGINNLPAQFGRLGEEVLTLLETQLDLLKVEIKEEANTYLRDALMIGGGGIVAIIGFALLNVAIACFVASLFTFSLPVNYALGFLITGAFYLVIGGILVVVMKNRLAERNPVPRQSVEELGRDKQWVKNEIIE